VVLQDRQVLLVQRDSPRFWELPGGGMAPGETTEEAVVREVREETGVQVEIVELLGWYERTGFRAHRSPVYLCHPCGGQPQGQDDDTMQVRYFPLLALPYGLCPWYRVILERDLPRSPKARPLQHTQHLGLWTVLHCLGLDVASRLGLLRE
jgi:ADP-ribose pyrophosphatase YjhB (NUDIX family)